MNEKLMEDFSKRLGIRDSNTLRKSIELLRLINLKKITINDTSKITISIDCASTLCNTELDRGAVIQLSGLNKKEYFKQKELFEKVLDLNKKLTLDEICAQLEISYIIKKDATRLLMEYKKKHAFDGDILNNIQFLSMAIYQSLELRKMKNNNTKTKLIQLSRLKGTVWKRMDEEWTNWIERNPSVADYLKSGTHNDIQADQNNTYYKELENHIKREECEIPYEEWSKSVIKRAKMELVKLKNSQ